MIKISDTNKKFRLLSIFERLTKGEVINTSEEADKFSVSKKSIKRDIKDLRAYLVEFHIYDVEMEICYSPEEES